MTRLVMQPANLRNRARILAALRRLLPGRGLVLEVASGTGEHAAWLAPRLAPRRWLPSECEPALLEDIRAWARTAAEEAGPAAAPLAPLMLDVIDAAWPVARAEAVVSINLIHIAPWAATEGLIAGAARTLAAGGTLYLYGPFRISGRHTAPSNAAFDDWLRAQDAAWGVRDLDQVAALAARHRLVRTEVLAMPANNLSVAFRKWGG